jgi:2-methylisocitrate lyase-like PEP mutase family enzyme
LEEGFVLAPGVYSASFAKLVEEAGFGCIYVTGFGTAARYGQPDVGLITQTEMVSNIREICSATGLPVIADADTGYGNAINVTRTVRLWEGAGAAALHLEDQVFPKKCGFMRGKQVIPVDEAVAKLHAALDARADDLVVIARTDALAVHGWDDVIVRAQAYRDAGADLVFVDGIRTRDDLDTYSSVLAQDGFACLYNGTLAEPDEVERLGFKVQILAGIALGAVYRSATDSMASLREDGTIAAVADRYNAPPPLEGINQLLDLKDHG